MMTKATYRIIYFPKADKYIGVAWNYDEAVLVSTRAQANYTEARNELNKACSEQDVELRWFDGEYEYGSDGLMVSSKLS